MFASPDLWSLRARGKKNHSGWYRFERMPHFTYVDAPRRHQPGRHRQLTHEDDPARHEAANVCLQKPATLRKHEQSLARLAGIVQSKSNDVIATLEKLVTDTCVAVFTAVVVAGKVSRLTANYFEQDE